eukprot:COSAG06_NODE_3203_length_5690_cov_1.769272_4_plen_77_part_00
MRRTNGIGSRIKMLKLELEDNEGKNFFLQLIWQARNYYYLIDQVSLRSGAAAARHSGPQSESCCSHVAPLRNTPLH